MPVCFLQVLRSLSKIERANPRITKKRAKEFKECPTLVFLSSCKQVAGVYVMYACMYMCICIGIYAHHIYIYTYRCAAYVARRGLCTSGMRVQRVSGCKVRLFEQHKDPHQHVYTVGNGVKLAAVRDDNGG